MADLLELAARCEAATGPDRELDSDIAVLVLGWSWADCPPDNPPMWLTHEGALVEATPPYTASLDAAMTLVPEGMHVAWERTICGDDTEIYNADVWGSEGRPFDWMVEAYNSPALALCAAALRARATPSTPQDR